MCCLMLVVCTVGLVNCVSPLPVKVVVERPLPGQWCRVTYPSELIGPYITRHRLLTGRVKSVEQDSIQLSDVAEDLYVIKGPASWRKIPFLSRLTTVSDVEVKLVEERSFSPGKINQIEVLNDRDAKLDRASIVRTGQKWERVSIGIDADVQN